MEIHGNTAAPSPLPAGGQCEVKAPDAEGAPAGRSAGDRADASGEPRVALSDRARNLLAAKQAVDAAPDVRASRVDDLKEQVAAGTYDVQGRLVAEAVARHALLEAVA